MCIIYITFFKEIFLSYCDEPFFSKLKNIKMASDIMTSQLKAIFQDLN